jgi:hypothetical protein
MCNAGSARLATIPAAPVNSMARYLLFYKNGNDDVFPPFILSQTSIEVVEAGDK